jgi:ATP/maltotriose-dependent transcriptional regulator MalT
VARATPGRWQRARLLPACVEIFLASGDLAEARAACDELDALARELDGEALRALAAEARGGVEIGEGRAEAALSSLRGACEIWQRIGAPYLVARTRALIGLANRALGDDEGAALELDAARTTFRELGATSDLRRVEDWSRHGTPAKTHGLTLRELDVLRLVAGGMTNKVIAGRLFVSERTVDRHVSNIFSKLGVSSRAAATAYAFRNELYR